MQRPRDTLLRYEWGPLFKANRPEDIPRTPQTAQAVVGEIRTAMATAGLAEIAAGTEAQRAVIERAKDPENLLHGFFTWADDEAGERWRLEQARDLIRGVRVVAVTYVGQQEVAATPVPVWASVRLQDQPRRYREVVVLTESADGRAALLAEALQQLARFQARYEALRELAGVMAAIQDLLTTRIKTRPA